MMSVREKIKEFRHTLPTEVELIAVSKFHTVEEIKSVYDTGERHFGESRVQELQNKYTQLPDDIYWHFIGHLQTNKIKYIAPFVSLIHSVDSVKLLEAINREATKINRKLRCLLQVHIASEETKYGFSPEELQELLGTTLLSQLENVEIIGLMGMATNTDNRQQIKEEFAQLRLLYVSLKNEYFASQSSFCELSMGMSQDYAIAIEEGSTMIRVGTAIFGKRTY